MEPELNIHLKINQEIYNNKPALKKHIIEAACETFNISESDFKSKTQRKELVRARQFCMVYTIANIKRNSLNPSLKSIGEDYGKRDHATVLYAKRLHQNALDIKDKIWLNDWEIFLQNLLKKNPTYTTKTYFDFEEN